MLITDHFLFLLSFLFAGGTENMGITQAWEAPYLTSESMSIELLRFIGAIWKDVRLAFLLSVNVFSSCNSLYC